MLCKNVKSVGNIVQMFVGNILQQCFQDIFKHNMFNLQLS